ncbi:hypothetical protein QJS10_CPB14g01653 [Acorus calamus]|uniref:C2H2-type domain-containing protein n=1 Tax=Acorus calamus TaxID=4465 RepID=A0AAV9DA81_ACOCL|nr:hypothetical protein QJS10_CPB14g01653 [Acorus calamus]
MMIYRPSIHPHQLHRTNDPLQYRCNACNTYGSGDHYRCNHCNFDLCVTCPDHHHSTTHPAPPPPQWVGYGNYVPYYPPPPPPPQWVGYGNYVPCYPPPPPPPPLERTAVDAINDISLGIDVFGVTDNLN